MVNEQQYATEGGAGESAVPVAANAEVPAARSALVKRWLTDIRAAEKHWQDAFDRMKLCQKIAAHGTTDMAAAKAENGSYVVPVINRHINQAVATLFAKNPQTNAKRKEKLYYQLWDGDPNSIAMAQQTVAVTQQMMAQAPPTVDPATGQLSSPPVPVEAQQAMALLQEVQAVRAQLIMRERMAKTLKLLFDYYLDEQDSGYKEQLKAMVRRAKVNGVAYVDLGFQRVLQPDPDVAAQIADVTRLIVAVENGLQRMQEGKLEADSADAERLKLQLADLQSRAEIIVREGPVLSFPRSTDIIPDKDCRHLKTFAGCNWVARRYDMTPERIKEVYGVDVKNEYTPYNDGKVIAPSSDGQKTGCARVYRVQDKKSQQEFVVCDGYCDFLKEPGEPDVRIERFWTVFPLVFNEIEHDEEVFPPSDVWNTRHMQIEYNSSRQGKREHKKAARPRWVTPKGKMEDEDRNKIANSVPFEVIEIASLQPTDDVKKLLQVVPVPGVDPNLYDTEMVFADIQRAVGSQAANLGGTSGDTATETSIAENSRATSNASDVDDLDTMLSALVRAMGQLLFLETSKETVIEIAGPGAVWPDAPPTREEVVKELVLDVEAGSSGRPNQAAELANLERAMPWLQMLPGINPMPLAKKGLGLININGEDAVVEGLPSIQALNKMAGAAPMGGSDDPNQQGDKGADNTERNSTQTNEPQSQPAYPAPGSGMEIASGGYSG